VVAVLKVKAELGHPAESELGIAMGVEVTHRLFGLPERGDVAVGIAGVQ